MGKSENLVVRGCLKLLSERGYIAFRFNNQPIAQRVGNRLVGYRKNSNPKGMPDIVAVSPNGRAIFVECKSETGRVSKEQAAILRQLEINDAFVTVVRSVAELLRELVRAETVNWSGVMSLWSDEERRK